MITNLMKLKEWKNKNDEIDTIYFRAACACMEDSHDTGIWIEKDEETETLTIHFYNNMKTKWWRRPTKFEWLNAVINRVQGCYELVFKGYIEFHSDIIVTEDNIDAFITALEEGKKIVKH